MLLSFLGAGDVVGAGLHRQLYWLVLEYPGSTQTGLTARRRRRTGVDLERVPTVPTRL
jgi:hypothetical protein